MFLKKKMNKYTDSYLHNIEKLKDKIKNSDAILVGIGAGMSTSAGFTYSGERFEKYFSDFGQKYGITDMYSGGFYPFKTLEEYWAWWSRHIYYNRYDIEAGEPYKYLYEILKDKNYFVITTNVDHQVQLAGFNKERLFYTQGDYGLWQCSKPCHQKTYDNEDVVRNMIKEQKNMKIPSNLVPMCPVCGSHMTMNLRSDDSFVEDDGWKNAQKRYSKFVDENKNKNILFFELGVGDNTPIIIKYPFLQMTYKNEKSTYACINVQKYVYSDDINYRVIHITNDISDSLCDILDK